MEGEDWPTIYYPYTQASPSGMALVVRTAGRPYDLSSAIAREVHRVDADQPLAEVVSMEDVMEQAMAGAKFNTVVLGAFAAIAFLLAAVGIYGVVSYDVSQRTHEIGIRMALGADTGRVIGMVVRQGIVLAVIGIAIGSVASMMATRMLEDMLFGVTTRDPVTFIAVALILGIVSIAASFIPARRASRVDPLVALRSP
jgi:putative ABC transport system permease protein